jgi:transcription-repair coupling factor (superfamily II helicase)
MENILSMQPNLITRDNLEIGKIYINIQDGICEFRGICDYDGKNVYAFKFGVIHGITQTLYMKEEELINLREYDMPEGSKKKIKLTRLRTMEWAEKVRKAKEKINNEAEQLVELYNKQINKNGFQFPNDDTSLENFMHGFKFNLTKSQFNAIKEIKSKMNSNKMSNVLLLGDTGSGKTAVAMCLMFKCAIQGYQSTLIAPSTILAEQHYTNFIERFKDYPNIRIGLLTSGIKASQKKKVIEDIANNKLDIVIGTQSLLTDKVQFANLKYAIYDEAHSYGIKDKEKLKIKFKDLENILMMTGTAIPRDLLLAKVGLKDVIKLESISIRKPIKSKVIQGWNEQEIKPYVDNEINNNGQIFVMLNDISGLEKMKEKMLKINNKLKIDIIHGKMKKSEINDKMRRFKLGEFNTLVSTSIISVGVDIPRVNLILINNCESLGLAISHQLRGRVGRNSSQSYCLFITGNNSLSSVAHKRLEALSSTNQLGGGLILGEIDFKIRGGGQIVSSKMLQSGHFSDEKMGQQYFFELLEQSIQNKKLEKGIN